MKYFSGSYAKMFKSLLINGLIVLCVYLAVHYYKTHNLVVGIAPELSGYTVDGQYMAGLDTLEGPAIIHFWATWCKICEFEHDAISRLSQDYPVISIASFSGTDDEVRAYIANNNIVYPVMNDVANRFVETWGVSAYPTSFIVDRNKKIRFVEVGLTTEIGLRARLWLARLYE